MKVGSGKSIGLEKQNSSLPYFSINFFDVTLAEIFYILKKLINISKSLDKKKPLYVTLGAVIIA